MQVCAGWRAHGHWDARRRVGGAQARRVAVYELSAGARSATCCACGLAALRGRRGLGAVPPRAAAVAREEASSAAGAGRDLGGLARARRLGARAPPAACSRRAREGARRQPRGPGPSPRPRSCVPWACDRRRERRPRDGRLRPRGLGRWSRPLGRLNALHPAARRSSIDRTCPTTTAAWRLPSRMLLSSLSARSRAARSYRRPASISAVRRSSSLTRPPSSSSER